MPNNKHGNKKEAESDLNSEFKMKGSGDAIHKLLSNAQPVNVDNRHLDEYYNTRIAKYSIQFQGCNQIKHWNKDAEDEDDVRISTKRLVRFRLVPFEKCSAYNPWMDASGIQNARNMIGKADYGDYVVDMNTFVEAYSTFRPRLMAMAEMMMRITVITVTVIIMRRMMPMPSMASTLGIMSSVPHSTLTEMMMEMAMVTMPMPMPMPMTSNTTSDHTALSTAGRSD